MSYCRWSTDNFRCDLYCYESARGFVTHVAGNRLIGPSLPSLPLSISKYPGGSRLWLLWRLLQNFIRSLCIRRYIRLPHAGESFTDVSLEAFRERLIYLRGLGYRFPDAVLSAIDQDINEERTFKG